VIGDALLVDGGHVVAVGSREHLTEPAVDEQHHPGAVLVPGFRDAHFHPVGYAATLGGVQLSDAADLDSVRRTLRRAAASSPPDRTVVGLRLDDQTLAEKRLPTRHDIDAAVSDRAVLLKRYCGHVAIVNTAALRAAGVGAETPDPPGGRIDRDPDGAPSGILRETAIERVSVHLGASESPGAGDLQAALAGLAGLGITSIGAMLGLGDGAWANLGNEVDTMIAAAPHLPIRVHVLVIASAADRLREAAGRLAGRGSRLRWLGLKMFADGSFGGHTAAMYETYSDLAGEYGTLRLTESDERLARTALEMGGSVAVHAIGDRAAGVVLDMFERLVGEGIDPRRLRIEHASVLSKSDIDRLGSLGVSACVQPAFIGSETSWIEDRIGPDRLARTYAFASLERAGAYLAGSSDCPVEPPHPLRGIALARDRDGLVPGESLSPERALALFTTGAARSLGEPVPLSIGSPADVVALDRDPVTSTPDEVRGALVIETWVDGEPVEVDRNAPVWSD
jgi:predicted amidohydrolase YtcJ